MPELRNALADRSRRLPALRLAAAGFRVAARACWRLCPATPTTPPLPPNRLLTGRAWSDMTLGILLTFFSVFVVGIGLIAMPILYFMLRATFPMFTRGIGYGLLGALMVTSGIFVLLLVGIAAGR